MPALPQAVRAAPGKPRRTRLEQAQQRALAVARQTAGRTQPQAALDCGVARSTLQEWCRRPATVAVPAAVAEFVETPQGVRWLQRLIAAAHFAVTLLGGAGVRIVCQFLELSGLSAFVGASYGSQQAFNVALEEAVVERARAQRTALAVGMAPRRVTVCEDETFHPQICLICIEPVSNFILAEHYAADRTAATWTQVLAAAGAGLSVEIIQGTSDGAKARRRHVEVDQGAQHSPDLFHVQHDVSKATSLHLARQVRQCAATVASARACWEAERAAEQDYAQQWPRPCGRPPAFAARIQAALNDLIQAAADHAQAHARQTQARDLVRRLGTLYHPYDLEHGQVQSVEQLAPRLADLWTRLREVAAAADLPTRARALLAKAERLTTPLLATLAFFFATIQATIDALALPPAVEPALFVHLIPALYLERAAARSTRARERRRLRALSAQLLEPLRQSAHPLQVMAPTQRQHLERVAGDCADLFQRSSSCVEGRNGQLALYHHGRHRLSDRKLAALTAVHNFHLRCRDGTTAAQRFFGRAHDALFAQVLTRMPRPPRPARRRPHPPQQPRLCPVAA
jgi:hypothetical protein